MIRLMSVRISDLNERTSPREGGADALPPASRQNDTSGGRSVDDKLKLAIRETLKWKERSLHLEEQLKGAQEHRRSALEEEESAKADKYVSRRAK